jgi:hypothetical protein
MCPSNGLLTGHVPGCATPTPFQTDHTKMALMPWHIHARPEVPCGIPRQGRAWKARPVRWLALELRNPHFLFLTISLLPSYTHGQLLLPLSKTRNHPSCAGGGVLRYPLPGLITSRVSDSWSSAGYRKHPRKRIALSAPDESRFPLRPPGSLSTSLTLSAAGINQQSTS